MDIFCGWFVILICHRSFYMMKHVHFIGIGGVGLSAMAQILLEQGSKVTGSDRSQTQFGEKLQHFGARVDIGHHAKNILGAEMVIRSSAIPDDNVEVLAARAEGIPVLKRAEFLPYLLADKQVIAVAGTHGKTTTTAMIAWMLTSLGQDPSYIIGGESLNLGTNAHAGNGEYFVIEADEYDRMFLGMQPKIAVVTNVEHDHPDCFPTPREFQQAFIEFGHRLRKDGTLFACTDEPGAHRLMGILNNEGYKTASYGLNMLSEGITPEVWGDNLQKNNWGGYNFEVYHNKKACTHISLKMPGRHNIQNALATIAVGQCLGLSPSEAGNSLATFSGTSRRFEVRGEVQGVVVIDDYAHHPTEIRTTLAAAKDRFPHRHLWALWQPHTYSRTRTLFKDYITSFSDADHVLVTEVFPAREPYQPDFSAKQLVNAMSHPDACFVGNLEEAVQILLSRLKHGDVLLVLSAGDADWVSQQILMNLSDTS